MSANIAGYSDVAAALRFRATLPATSPAGEVDRFNPQILEYCGKAPQELKGWATSDAVHPDDIPRVVAAFSHSITTGTPYDIGHRCCRPDDGSRFAPFPCELHQPELPAGTSC
ncbi:MAG TPA: PAS domain-containing protein [Bryobacteraceae bacterium]|nr:PAS domain-containing protein [Bryobacteraceae bacterium]